MFNDNLEFSPEEVTAAIAFRNRNPRAVSTTSPTNANFLIEVDGHFAATQVTFLPKQDWDGVKHKSGWRYTMCCAQVSKNIAHQRIKQDVQSVLEYYFQLMPRHIASKGVEDSHPHCLQDCKARAERNLEQYKHNATSDPYSNLDKQTAQIADKTISRIKIGLRTKMKETGIQANTPTQWYSKFAAGAIAFAGQKTELGTELLNHKTPKAMFERYWLNVIQMVNSLVDALYHGSWGQQAYQLYHAFAVQYIMFKDIKRLGDARRLRVRNYMINQLSNPASIERLPLMDVFDPAEFLSNTLTIDYNESNRILGLPGLSNRTLSIALMDRITPCAKEMLGIHNASSAIDESVHDDNRSSTNEPARDDSHSDTDEPMHDDDPSHTKCSQYEARPSHFEKAPSTIQSSLASTAVALPSYATFQQPVSLSIPDQATVADLYPGQMIMPMAQSSSYNGIASYGTSALSTGPGHDQISEPFDLSMPMTQSTPKYAYDVNLGTYESFYDGEHVFSIY